MNIIISNSANIPIYEQIKQQIKSAVFDGGLEEGELLPSIRQLARDLKISVITTTRAYNELEQEGLIVTVQGKGCYVQPQNKDLMREQKLRAIEQSLSDAIATSRFIKLSNEELKRMLDILLEEDIDE
ncbi:MAG: GntR family transcriptional regulator [Eubacteriales bacterium]